MIVAALSIGFGVGLLAGVALTWPYARREGWHAGAMYAQRAMARSVKVKNGTTIEDVVRKLS